MQFIQGKKQIIVALVCIVGLAIIGWAGFQFYDGVQSLAKTRRSLRAAKTRLESLFDRDPFPSETNVVRLASSAKMIEEWNERILQRLVERQPFFKNEELTDQTLTPAQFIQRLNRVRQRLILKAPSQRVRVRQPEQLWFGFEDFAGGQLPATNMDNESRKTAVRLMFEQLDQTEDLVNLLYRAGIDELVSVTRRSVYTVGTPLAPETLTGEGQIAEGDIYGVFRFGLNFKARESGFINVLNELAVRDAFTVVTSVSVRRIGTGLKMGTDAAEKDAPGTRSVRASERGVGIADLLFADEPVATEPLPGALPGELVEKKKEGDFTRLVSGPDLEEPMDVTIKLNVYKFRGGQRGR